MKKGEVPANNVHLKNIVAMEVREANQNIYKGKFELDINFDSAFDLELNALRFLEVLRKRREPLYCETKDKLIQFIQEKCGINIKICGNCKSYRGIIVSSLVPGGDPKVICLKHSGKEDLFLEILSTGCEQWEPKEVSEKK